MSTAGTDANLSAPSPTLHDGAIETIEALLVVADRFILGRPSLLPDSEIKRRSPIIIDELNRFDESFCRFARVYGDGVNWDESLCIANDRKLVEFANVKTNGFAKIAFQIASEWHGAIVASKEHLVDTLRYEPRKIILKGFRCRLPSIEEYIDTIDPTSRVDFRLLRDELVAEKYRIGNGTIQADGSTTQNEIRHAPIGIADPTYSPRDPILGEREQCSLLALLEKRAFDSDHLIKTQIIAELAAGKGTDGGSFKEVIAKLKSYGYVETREGRSGGVWLTPDGKMRAESIKG